MQLIKILADNGVTIKSKNGKSPDLSKTLDQACSKMVIKKTDKKNILDARNALFHYNDSFLKFPYELNKVEKILDKYITKFLDKRYTTKGSIVIYAKQILQNIVTEVEGISDFKINRKSFSFIHIGKKFEGFLSFMPDTGGSRNKEYNKVCNLIANKNEDTIFLAICDGDYYLQKDSKTSDETKIKRLERLTDGKTSFALKIDDLKGFLEKL
jgi:hypothetical protein